MSGTEFLDQLNPPQREAVTYGGGPLLIVAGAGSGKTRVLTYRIAYLVRHLGVDPGRILATTFTNKAAGEMKNRARALLGTAAGDLWVGTFHSTCTRILRKDIHHLGYSPGFVIYDEKDTESLAKEALRRCDLDEKIYTPSAMRWQIDRAKNDCLGPEGLAASADRAFGPQVTRVYEVYQQLLRENNALDFGDLIRLTVMLFERFPKVVEWYREKWEHVLVDEYQDTNMAQYRLVRLLAAGQQNLCCVGDEDQNIYSWRGATIRNILDFEKDFPGAHVVKLEENYRSTNAILQAAGAVVARNRRRREKSLWTSRSGGHPATLYQAPNEFEEARYVVREIGKLRREGFRAGDFAIFYRTNAQSRVIEECLLADNYAYTVVGGVKFYARAEVKDLLAYMRVLHNPLDAVGLKRIINSPPRGIGKTTIARAEDLARERGLHLADALRALVEDERTGAAARRKVGDFLASLRELQKEAGTLLPSALLQQIIARSGYVDKLRHQDTPESLSRIENIDELVTSIYAFEENTPDATLGIYLDQISLVADVDSLDETADRVVLMTVHSAKGLEFPVVFMLGMEETLFPHSLSRDDPEAVEEERRLCYVGMTRAKDRLYLSHAVSRRVFGSLRFNDPSRFLAEIPEELLDSQVAADRGWAAPERSPARPVIHRPGASSSRPLRRKPQDGERVIDYSFDQSSDYGDEPGDGNAGVPALEAGDRVSHPNLGRGTVERLEGEGRRTRVVVRFERGGTRTLMLAYSELEIV
ncbi:MAG: UvrD-helicase domain-containing protein [Deltaproteobacteria bacterium]|nr:UvrD-helicase domain-containing protein [Deltaproteobacteria bacterium]